MEKAVIIKFADIKFYTYPSSVLGIPGTMIRDDQQDIIRLMEQSFLSITIKK